MKKTLYLVVLVLILVLNQRCSDGPMSHDQLKGKVKKEVINIAPKVPGRIEKLLVNEAEQVKRGDTLAILQIPEIEAKLLQARGALIAAESQYQMATRGATPNERKQIQASFDAAQEQFQLARKTYRRLEMMYTDSLIPAQKYDDIYAKYKSAEAQLNAAEARRNEVESGLRSEKVRMALGDLKRAEGALQEAETAYGERFLIAPANILIETISLQEGELALPGYNIFIGYLPESTYFRFTVSESKVMNYKLGQKVLVHFPFEPDLEIEAVLTSVKQLNSYADQTTPFPEYELGESIYELRLKPIDQEKSQSLYANLTISLEG